MHVVMTGATSGFGLDTATRLLDAGLDRLTIGARTPGDIDERLRRGNVEVLHLDLEELPSVHAFADRLGEDRIDALVLNAGIQLVKPQRAPNGMERTFLVNQLAHFLLLDLVRDRLAEGARVVFTASGTHDPDEETPLPAPVHADAERLAWPERDDTLPEIGRLAAMRAYTGSKLANVMTVRELARRDKSVVALAFDPGFVPGTNLARGYPWVLQKLFDLIVPFAMSSERASSIPNSGRLLALAVVDKRYDVHSGAYVAVRGNDLKIVPPSEMAQDEEKARKLWDDCERLVNG